MKTVAAFDFDGTITYRDSLLPFLFFTHGFIGANFNLFLCLPVFIGFIFRLSTRQTVKERILKQFYGGLPLSELRLMGEKYVKHGIKVRPEMIEKIRWHQQQGHLCVLVSASMDAYLEYWGKSMGFYAALTSIIDIDKEGRVTGKLKGLNCRGPEKVVRLKQLMGENKNYILYAYGDSAGDRELLQYADYSVYV